MTINPRNSQAPTSAQYAAIQKAYEFFNDELFEGKLPDVLFTFSRGRAYKGYFWAGIWSPSDADGETYPTDELALNPDLLTTRPMIETLSTLVHEMCHVEQEHFGENKPKSNYHNKEWASMMDAVGLVPSTTGTPDGKRTGQKVTHYIEQDGAFEKSAIALMEDLGWSMPWLALDTRTAKAEKRAAAKKASKSKHECPECHVVARAKADAKLVCGACMVPMEIDNPEDAETEGGEA